MKYIFVSKRQLYWRKFGKPLCWGFGGLLVCSFLVNILRGIL